MKNTMLVACICMALGVCMITCGVVLYASVDDEIELEQTVVPIDTVKSTPTVSEDHKLFMYAHDEFTAATELYERSTTEYDRDYYRAYMMALLNVMHTKCGIKSGLTNK